MRKVYSMRAPDSEAGRGGTAFNDLYMQSRVAGLALKRSASSDRENAGNGQYGSGLLEHAAREAIGYRSKSMHYRSFKGDKIDFSSRKNCLGVYQIAIGVIAVCFFAVTMILVSTQIVKHTDFLTIPVHEVFKTAENSLEAGGLSDCYRAVRVAVDNFTENLHPRTSLSEMWKMERYSRRPPQLALICPSLEEVPCTLYLITVARGLQWLGYNLELYTRQDGHLRTVWEDSGVPVHFVAEEWQNITIDWSLFEGVLAVSLDAKKTLESLVQEPFLDIPVIWIIHEDIVLDQDIEWNASDELQTIYQSWSRTFNRSSVVVFSNYFLPIAYKDFYNARFYVIAGSPWDVWEAEQYMMTYTREDVRAKAGLRSAEYVIVVVGSPCSSKEIWRDHAIIMKAVANLTLSSIGQDGMLASVRLLVVGHGTSTSGYEDILQMIAQNVGLNDVLVKHVGVDEDVPGVLWMADVVVYASVWEEPSFPPIVIQAMSFKRPVIVPDLDAFSQHIVDGHSGFLFSAGDYQALRKVLLVVISNPLLGNRVASEGSSLAHDLLARDAVIQHGYLLEKLLDFPEEAQLPRPTAELQERIPQGWRWDLLGEPSLVRNNSTVKDLLYLKLTTDLGFLGNDSGTEDMDRSCCMDEFDWLSEMDWDQERLSVESETWEEVENEEVKDRLDKVHTSLEEVNKMVKKTETRVAQDKHREVDHLEVERVAQPLCIYEPYHGPGAWSFLHKDHLLYQGLSLSAGGRRVYQDDVDGAGRLSLLNNSYYREALCDVAGLFAIAKFIDRVHRNPWIGFQPWRAASRKVALAPPGETALLAALSEGKDGDALYFWAQMESKDSEPVDDFWRSCDLNNGGNCRTVFLEAFKKMYGLPSTWSQLPPMPTNGGTWAAMHCWVMPTTSFLEFVMFSRMFVDALDALQYEDHHNRGRCCFSRLGAEVKHCYCNFLEGLVNVWAYHSARKMIYLDPESGLMQEQHNLENRRGAIWVKWFRRNLLQSMDEDLAEEADDEQLDRRWLWPETGEVFWSGTREKEQRKRYEAKVEKKRRQLERQARQSKYKQRPIGRYIKPKAPKLRSLQKLEPSSF